MATRLMTITPVQWVLYLGLAVAMASLVWAITSARSRGRVVLAVGIAAIALLAAGVAVLAGMGAFCVAPAGAACA